MLVYYFYSLLKLLGHVYYPNTYSSHFNKRKYVHDDDAEDEDDLEKKSWESNEKFESMTVWEHQALPDGKNDQWIRGLEEWVTMAETVSQLLK
jgi:Ribonuclease H2 non-catalytic subunit (Ylr154p-like)